MGRNAEAHDRGLFSQHVLAYLGKNEFPKRLSHPRLILLVPAIQKSMSFVFRGQP